MSEHDRGAYAPPTMDAPLSFDARQPVRGSRPFPLALIVSALVLIGLIAAIVAFYRSGAREAGQAPQSVGAPVGSMKSAAPADAQPEDPAAGLQIYHSESGQTAPAPVQPNFVPPPEQPAPRPAPAVSAPPPAPAPAPTTPAASGPALRPALPSAPPAVVTPPSASAVQPPPVKPVAAAPKPQVVAKSPTKPAGEAVPASSSKAGAAAVQIGAVSSTALADKAWNEAVAAAPGLAASKGKGVEKIERDGHILFRTSVTGFASRAEAAAFCARLKAAGKACFVK